MRIGVKGNLSERRERVGDGFGISGRSRSKTNLCLEINPCLFLLLVNLVSGILRDVHICKVIQCRTLDSSEGIGPLGCTAKVALPDVLIVVFRNYKKHIFIDCRLVTLGIGHSLCSDIVRVVVIGMIEMRHRRDGCRGWEVLNHNGRN